jgi:D-inositol-3-phosphate glycosyltransferase
MACGTPVVASDAVPVADGLNGLVVHSYSPRDYADALERLLKDGELWSRLQRNGLEYAKQFDHLEIAKRYVRVIESLLNDTYRSTKGSS